MCYDFGLFSYSAPRGCIGSISKAELHQLLDAEEDEYFTTKRGGLETHQCFDDTEQGDYFVSKCDSPHQLFDAKDDDSFTTNCDGSELHQLFDTEEDDYSTTNCEGPTTVMVRNIGYKYSTDDVREHLRELGFEGAYDFIYVPSFATSGTKKGTNFGYFFLNLVTPEYASSLAELLRGAHFGSRTKLCEVSPAEWQGLAELRAHFHKKRVTKGKASNRPLFL